MASLLSFPMRLSPNGTFAVEDDGSDDYLAGELAVLISTSPGERVLVPSYGMEDPTYGDLPEPMLLLQIEKFGPPVNITSLTTVIISDSTTAYNIEFDDALQVVNQDFGD